MNAIVMGTLTAEFLSGPIWAALNEKRQAAIVDQVQLFLRTDPSNFGEVAVIQGRIRALQACREWLDAIVADGQRAYEQTQQPTHFDD